MVSYRGVEIYDSWLNCFRYFADTLAHNENGVTTTHNGRVETANQQPPTRLPSPITQNHPVGANCPPGTTPVSTGTPYKDPQTYVHPLVHQVEKHLKQGPALEGRNSPVFAKRFWMGNKLLNQTQFWRYFLIYFKFEKKFVWHAATHYKPTYRESHRAPRRWSTSSACKIAFAIFIWNKKYCRSLFFV